MAKWHYTKGLHDIGNGCYAWLQPDGGWGWIAVSGPAFPEAWKEDKVKQLAGWNPSTKEYWKELDRRLSKRSPHLYNDDSDETSSRRPRQVVTSTGREKFGGSNPKSVTIPPELVRSIKDAGLWENIEARKRIVAGYFAKQRNA